MQKTILIKVIAPLLGVAAATVGIIVAVRYFTKEADTYRSILIYELEGTADIDREGAGTIAAAENLYLESGDRLTTASGSFVRLKLDDDKYIMVEEDTVVSIEAIGTKEDSKTRIQLEQGAITNETQNALSEESLYEDTTPNFVMAVRGTKKEVNEPEAPEESKATPTAGPDQDKTSASDPKLNPAPSGRWNFDFSTAIKKDTTIEWVE